MLEKLIKGSLLSLRGGVIFTTTKQSVFKTRLLRSFQSLAMTHVCICG